MGLVVLVLFVLFGTCASAQEGPPPSLFDEIIAQMKFEQPTRIAGRFRSVDGYEDATWILLDFDSVLAHVFLPGERSYYDLESLWGRAAKGRKKAS